LFADRAVSRRDFLKGSGKAALLGGLLGLGVLEAQPAAAANLQQPAGIDPLIWVWKFSVDGPLQAIKDTLASHGLGIILKTHDGTRWMEATDKSPDAVTGPGQVATLARTFEDVGVGFHAWCVVQGVDPMREAQMCAEVLGAGARDLYLDLEPSDGANYWQGSAGDALAFGEELRRLVPNARLVVAPDARPWQTASVPLAEFASFSNAIAPQSYWDTFQGPTNRRKYAEHGYWVGPEGITPELMIEAAVGTFQGFGRPVYPIGQGSASPDKWQRFIDSALAHGIGSMSLWRYGTADPSAFGVLRDAKPALAPEVAEQPPAPSAPEEAAAQAAVPQPQEDHVDEAAAPVPEGSAGLPDNELLHLEASGQIKDAPPETWRETLQRTGATPQESPTPQASPEPTPVVQQTIDNLKSRVTPNRRDLLEELLR
jgi:hypothetical protein